MDSSSSTTADMKPPQVIPWPTLTNQELTNFYLEIKKNRIINPNWNSPGRLDPKIVYENFETRTIRVKVATTKMRASTFGLDYYFL